MGNLQRALKGFGVFLTKGNSAKFYVDVQSALMVSEDLYETVCPLLTKKAPFYSCRASSAAGSSDVGGVEEELQGISAQRQNLSSLIVNCLRFSLWKWMPIICF